MNLDALRAGGKRLLNGHPKLYKLGQYLFLRFKEANDARIFKHRYPAAAVIHYDDARQRQLLAEGYHSQYGQDSYLWNEVFARKPNGFYVDIGGNDPVELSNTYFLEKQGWRGLAFDPLERAAKLWREKRSANFIHAAIAEVPETRNFTEINSHDGWEHALSAFSSYVREEDKLRYGFREYPVRAAPLKEFVPDGQHIDVIMVDVEGAEQIVLAGIDLAALKPDYVMVENVSEVGGSEKVRRLVLDKGYDLIARIGSADDLFKRRGA